ncbi:peptide chain release factor N(5)-glutamine methyltransferase [Adhaeribacter pallidiroseus]|uniref:Release factor glutamine methyltransferase n=1 Tax=Adhaeribacter pallidiroseus TaxID=2072847 RepID=A0A369QCV6_9BACT|nr:peptide chain release factor N(5)-glutamine methyltransferase [Adhaeribacter pallidiroseus]RDC62731.1 Peptide chain release factor N(5)-glutamine methyltransferase [Adhaeribacter pallidiroseus]
MKNLQNLLDYITRELARVYGPEEASAIARMLVEHELGWNRTQISLRKKELIQPEIWQKFTAYLSRLQNQEPVQYITRQAYFYELELEVSPAVLIPRPETEVLVQRIIRDNQANLNLQILDIGTGSGCIALALSKNLKLAQVYGLDVSGAALAVAYRNAQKLELSMQWLHHDIFAPNLPLPKQSLDLIVSNPPYVLESEKSFMRRNVLDFEPHLALFVPDAEALRYYQQIAEVAQQLLKPAGKIYFEVNEQFATAVTNLLQQHHFTSVQPLKDLFGKDRFVTGTYAG